MTAPALPSRDSKPRSYKEPRTVMSFQTRGILKSLTARSEADWLIHRSRIDRIRKKNRRMLYLVMHKSLMFTYGVAYRLSLGSVMRCIMDSPKLGRYAVGDFIAYVDPIKIRNIKDVKLRGFKASSSFFFELDTYSFDSVESGNKDHEALHKIFVDGIPYWETSEYKDGQSKLEMGLTLSKGMKKIGDIDDHFRRMHKLIDVFAEGGYKSQKELGCRPPFDEIEVWVDERGGFVKMWGGGTHRFGLARILKLTSIPVKIVGVHADWMRHCVARFKADPVSSVVRGIAESKIIDQIYYVSGSRNRLR